MKRMKKTFDCIAGKRQSQSRIYEEIKNLNPAEEAEYFKVKALSGPLGKWWKATSAGSKKIKAEAIAESKEDYSKNK